MQCAGEDGEKRRKVVATKDDTSIDSVIEALQKASVQIYETLRDHRGILESKVTLTGGGALGPRPKTNASGDTVAPLDEMADEIVVNALKECPYVAGFASEERKDFVPLNEDGSFIVVYDPLDGSQNLPVNLSVGSIWGVFRGTSLKEIKSGDDLIAAGYTLFSTALQFVWTNSRKGPTSLHQYDFKRKVWGKVLTNHTQPTKGKTYCINEGSAKNWTPAIGTFIANFMKGRSIRWMCCMVADVHRPLMQGGAFMYPSDKKYTRGRLRLVYEAYPMAFVWEACGGIAIHADRPIERSASEPAKYSRILETPFPHGDVHARTGVILLGKYEHAEFRKAITTA